MLMQGYRCRNLSLLARVEYQFVAARQRIVVIHIQPL
jgi:hypothetical protein